MPPAPSRNLLELYYKYPHVFKINSWPGLDADGNKHQDDYVDGLKRKHKQKNVKGAVLKANAQDLLLFRTIPAYYRSLPGDLANTLVEMDKAGATNAELGKRMGGFANLRIRMLEGDMDKGYVSVGHGISHIKKIMSAKEIINALCRDNN